jgi:hypothetical protein
MMNPVHQPLENLWSNQYPTTDTHHISSRDVITHHTPYMRVTSHHRIASRHAAWIHHTSSRDGTPDGGYTHMSIHILHTHIMQRCIKQVHNTETDTPNTMASQSKTLFTTYRSLKRLPQIKMEEGV